MEPANGEVLAPINGIWPLTADHRKVINFVWKFYLGHSVGPTRIKYTGPRVSAPQRLFELFSGAITWNADCVAGVPHPGKTYQHEESGVRSPTGQALASPRNSGFPVPAPGEKNENTILFTTKYIISLISAEDSLRV